MKRVACCLTLLFFFCTVFSRNIAADSGQYESEAEGDGGRKPGFSKLRWLDGEGKESGGAVVDDRITLSFNVENIDTGESVNIGVWEHSDSGEHSHLTDLRRKVKNGAVVIAWKVIYVEENSVREQEEKGYALPKYFFRANYKGVESEDSPFLEIKGWIILQLKDRATGMVWANRGYTIILPDGTKQEGKTDRKGNTEKIASPFGNVLYYVHEEEETDG